MFHEGEQVGPYVLVKKLGKGGFGEVWLAEKRSQFLAKKVAVKLLHGDQVNFETIQREAVLWEEASGHPNVLPIIDADIYGDQVVIVSEYADGGSLADKLQSVGTTSVRDAVDLTIGILNGLEFLHGRKIIHRDIKPQNILLQGKTPRLADFGISRAMQTGAVSSTVIGTDAYMSPEAFDGKRSVQTDIWSVGVVLYQLLNGSLPFPQDHPSERMFAVLTKEFVPLSDDIPSDLQNIVQTSLAKLPENRFQSAAAMGEALQRVLVGIDHPTFAKTEVLRIPITYETESRMPTIAANGPIEQETQVAFRPNYTEPQTVGNRSVMTQVAIPTSESAHSRQPIPPLSVEMKFALGLFAFFALGVIVFISSALSNRTDLTAGNKTALNYNIPTSTPAKSSPGASLAANKSNVTTGNLYTSSTPPTSPTQSSTANFSQFCRGYIDGWNNGWNSVKGKGLPPVAVPCPDEKNYKDKSYDGGQITGYYQGMTKARSVN